jgi:hypothetical protein
MATTIPAIAQKVARDYTLRVQARVWGSESASVVGDLVGGIGEEIAQIAYVPSSGLRQGC